MNIAVRYYVYIILYIILCDRSSLSSLTLNTMVAGPLQTWLRWNFRWQGTLTWNWGTKRIALTEKNKNVNQDINIHVHV